jgi:hypothetical protein
MNDVLLTLPFTNWKPELEPEQASQATAALERGGILFLPQLSFDLTPDERRFLAPRWLDGKAKNISYNPSDALIHHTSAVGNDRAALTVMMARFSQQSYSLLLALCPHYAAALEYGLTSFRPTAIEGRPSSAKKDDTRLHIDAFASRPNQGRRILRVFCNINPSGESRVWNIGEPFEAVARRFRNRVSPQWPGSARLLAALGITKGRRSAYDHVMLNLHDHAKLDTDYQRSTPKHRIEFPSGSTWVVYTDRVMHAALGGQFLCEQTFYLPVAAMQKEHHAPLRVLERLWQRQLV